MNYCKTHSEETKRKIAASCTGRKHSAETIEKIRQWNLGRKMPESAIAKKRGIKLSPETREKISIAHKGMKVSEETRRKMSLARMGKVQSDETKEKRRLWMVENCPMRGKKNPKNSGPNNKSWKGGKPDCVDCGIKLVSRIATRCRKCNGLYRRQKAAAHRTPGQNNKAFRTTVEYRLWREAVFSRDGWTCQQCWQKGGYLHAHHIKPFAKYPELRTAIDNGVTLCVDCHATEHGRPKRATVMNN